MQGKAFKKIGPSSFLIILIAAAVIVVILSAGFLFGSRLTTMPVGQISDLVDQQTQDLKKLSSSDEVVEIEKDLSTTDIDNLDNGIGEIEPLANEL